LGGYGSGRHRFSKKTPVEDCFTLNVEDFTSGDLLHSRPWGEIRWTRGGAETGSVDFQLRDIGFKERESVYILTLLSPLIHRGQRIPVTQNIPLVTTRLCSEGKRYWFSCPNCRERVGRLHLPYGGRYFFCRKCYGLTYMSCQDSHKFDAVSTRMGVSPLVWNRLFNLSKRN
jgi:hypothetical protein